MHRCTANAAGGTSQREKPGCATVASLEKNGAAPARPAGSITLLMAVSVVDLAVIRSVYWLFEFGSGVACRALPRCLICNFRSYIRYIRIIEMPFLILGSRKHRTTKRHVQYAFIVHIRINPIHIRGNTVCAFRCTLAVRRHAAGSPSVHSRCRHRTNRRDRPMCNRRSDAGIYSDLLPRSAAIPRQARLRRAMPLSAQRTSPRRIRCQIM